MDGITAAYYEFPATLMNLHSNSPYWTSPDNTYRAIEYCSHTSNVFLESCQNNVLPSAKTSIGFLTQICRRQICRTWCHSEAKIFGVNITWKTWPACCNRLEPLRMCIIVEAGCGHAVKHCARGHTEINIIMLKGIFQI